MFSLFKKPASAQASNSALNDNITIIDSHKMTLDERKMWRTNIVRQKINEVFSSCNITSSMYKYRILPLDDRAHSFVILIETTSHFALSKFAETSKLSCLETKLKSVVNTGYGVIIDSIYWKVTETVDVFEKTALSTLPLGKSKKTITDLTKMFSKHHETDINLDICEHELAAFKDALDSGKTPQVGGKEYDTDLSPLGPQ